MGTNIIPVILCGGSGTRLWPVSRSSYPKQFVPLTGKQTLFQATAERLSGQGFGAPIIVTHSDFRFIVTEQLAAIGIDPAAVLIEPEGRNTAPAVLAAALWQAKRDPDALLLVAPSDHAVSDSEAFRQAVWAGTATARDGQLVTFGIAPSRAETGYGYLELASAPAEPARCAYALSGFIEKPNAQRAGEMLAAANVLWNAGIFLFSAGAGLKAYRAHAPGLCVPVNGALENGKPDLGFFRLDPARWAQAQNISIDKAVMERAGNLSVVPFAAGWSDLGGWDAVWRESGRATALDCDDTLLRSEDDALEVVGIGLKNIIAVAMPDAVLVADASRAQDVKQAVSVLKARQVKQATKLPRDFRPWGWFESLAVGERFQVKRIVVHPGASLSLQSHHHRSEHWIVVEGTAKVTVDGLVSLVTENGSLYVPLGAVHRLENPGKVPMTLIEVQTGTYLGEDDIIRYEDRYART